MVLFRLNRKAKYQLEKDLKNKATAIDIDQSNADLRNNSAGVRCNVNAAKVPPKYVTATLPTAQCHSR